LSCLTLVGIGLIFSFDTKFRLGITLGVISSILVALFTIYNERLSKTYEVLELTKIQMFLGSVGIFLLLPIIIYFYPIDYFLPSKSDFFYLILLSGFCTVLLYILLNTALKKISAFTVNLSFNLEPIYTILIAVVFFDEYKDLNVNFYIGLVLILLSLLLQMRRVIKKNN